LLLRIAKILSEYEVDGIYIDAGYFTNAAKEKMPDESPLKKPARSVQAAVDRERNFRRCQRRLRPKRAAPSEYLG